MPEENPWGKKKNPQNIDDLVDEGLKKIQNLFGSGGQEPPSDNRPKRKFEPPKGSNRKIFFLFLIAVVAFSVWQSFYVIQPGERGVVLRFGKFDRNGESGLNFLIPYVEKVSIVDVESVRTLEFGFSGPSEREVTSRSFLQNTRTYDTESLMLTGDRNVINLNWVVQYRIKEPEKYLFHTQNPVSLVNDVCEFVLRRLVGNRDFDYVLDKREEVAFETQAEMQQLLDADQYDVGIEVVKVQLLDVTPPEAVRPSFNEVNEADQDKTRLVNEAQKVLNEVIPKAKGQAQQLIQEAQGYAVQRLNRAKGEISRFNNIYNEYRQYKDVTRTRIYVETMREVLPTVEEVVVIDKNNSVLPLLNIGNSANQLPGNNQK